MIAWLRWLHLVAGLQASAALVVYAVAGLVASFESKPPSAEALFSGAPRESRAFAPGPAGESDLALATRLHRELALPFTDPPRPPALRREVSGALTFRLFSPNGPFRVRVAEPGVAEIEHVRVGLGHFLLNVHGQIVGWPPEGKDARLVLWSLWNELSLVSLLGLSCTGPLLFVATRPRARLPLAAFALGCASCALLVWRSW